MKHKRRPALAGAAAIIAFAVFATIPARTQMLSPSVLSRGGNAAGMRGSDAVAFTFYGGASGYYDTGIYVPQGQTTPQSQFGGGFSWGAYGGHSGPKTTLGFDYRGDYRYYTVSSTLNGTNDVLDFNLSHVFNRRWQLAVYVIAGTTTQAFGGFTAPTYITSNNVSVPLNEIYNTRIYYTQANAYATYNWSSRTLLTLGGGGFLTHRTAAGLVSTNGGYAIASWQHLVSHHNAIGVSYNYSKYVYPPAYGSSDVNTVSGTFERSIGRYFNLFVAGGASQVKTLGTESYALSPEISAILGVPTGVRVFYKVNYIPNIQATINYRKRNWGYTGGYSRGPTPGNGVYLTSNGDVFSAGASYAGIRRASFGLNASVARLVSLWQTADPYLNLQAGVGFSYRLGRDFNFVSQVDWRTLTAGSTINRQRGFVATAGIAYSNATRPLSLW